MSRENKKASGKQWNRSGSGKKFTAPYAKRVSGTSLRRPRLADKDWPDSVDSAVDASDEFSEEGVSDHEFQNHADPASALAKTDFNENGWLTKLLAELRGEPNIDRDQRNENMDQIRSDFHY